MSKVTSKLWAAGAAPTRKAPPGFKLPRQSRQSVEAVMHDRWAADQRAGGGGFRKQRPPGKCVDCAEPCNAGAKRCNIHTAEAALIRRGRGRG
jgi:hypothetical protein